MVGVAVDGALVGVAAGDRVGDGVAGVFVVVASGARTVGTTVLVNSRSGRSHNRNRNRDVDDDRRRRETRFAVDG